MKGPVLLTTITVVAVFAAGYWTLLDHGGDPVRVAPDQESALGCIQGDMKVTANLLNVRTLPVNGKVIGRFSAGSRLKVLRCAVNWAEIIASGWVHAGYLRPEPDGSAYTGNHGAMASDNRPPSRSVGPGNCGTGYRKVSGGRLNLRTVPADGSIIGQLVIGTGVTVVRCDGDWAEVTMAGWAHTDYLSTADGAVGPEPRQ